MDKTDIFLKEYEGHLARYRQLAERATSLQHYAIVLSSATWAWVLTNGSEHTVKILIWLPTALTALYALNAAFLHVVSDSIFARLRKIEEQFKIPAEESFYDREIRAQQKHFIVWLAIFWVSIFTLNSLGAILGFCNPDWFKKP